MISNRAIFYFILSHFFYLSFSFSQTQEKEPFKLEKNEEIVLISAGAAVGLTALVIMFNNDKLTEEQINSLNQEDVNNLDRLAIGPYQSDVLGDVLFYSSFLLPLSFLTNEDMKEDFSTLSLIYGEAVLVNASINALIKGLSTRTRPYVYDPGTPLTEKNKVEARYSFYSGHTSFSASNSFFTAKIFSEYLTDNTAKVLIWSAAALIPAVTGFSRVNTHNHFPTDVIVGYIVGAAIGYLLPEIHKYEHKSSNSAAPEMFIHQPIFGFQISF